MKKIALILIICFAGLNAIAQSEEAATWYFGYNSGIKFNQANNTVSSLNDGELSTFEGCATISDNSGDLLFYTDGLRVWNKNHDIMSNGLGLFGDPSSTQSAIIIPKPNDENIYYIFTVDDQNRNETHLGLNYSIVDMTLDNGLGAITNKNINLLSVCSEKITAVVKDCITESIWVLAFASENGNGLIYDTFHAFEVNNLGVTNNSITSPFDLSITDRRGYLKFSPDGTKMACANVSNGIYLYDFNTNTGKVSNQQNISIGGLNNNPYGVEFSPNSKLLYVSYSNDFFDFNNPQNNEVLSNHRSILAQYNLDVQDIKNSAVIIDDRQLYRGGLQLGPDGRIYRALSATYTQGLPYLGVINNPNNLGTDSNYQHNAINLSPNTSSQGLPPFISSFFAQKIDIIGNNSSSTSLSLCLGDMYTLRTDYIPGASYTWTRNGTLLAENKNELTIDNDISGFYKVFIDLNTGKCDDTFEGVASVTFITNPLAYNAKLLQCDEDGIADDSSLFNLNKANNILTGEIPSRSTKFYIDYARNQEIVDGSSFKNTTNPQTIFVEVINDDTGCKSNSELTLEISITDSNDALLTLCDNDGTEDGFQTFNLKEADSQIINGLPNPNDLIISYYRTYDESLLEINTIDIETPFTNTIPYEQRIYARVENANNCYGISEVLLTVNKLPSIDSESLDYYCLNIFPEKVSINAGITNDNPNNYSYSWKSGESTYDIEINAVGTYFVTVTNNDSTCSKSKEITIEPSNIATFESIDIIDASKNNTITANFSGEGLYEYALYDEDHLMITPYQESNVFENVTPGFYNVYVKDIKNDCGFEDEPFSVIGFPKYFTPNNDGVNDTWQVIGVSKMFQPNTKILIFNRYGKLLKEIDPKGQGWNGTTNGQKLPAADYWFSVKLEDGREIKNHFTLKL